MNLESLTDRISNNPYFGQAFWFCFNQLESVENLAVIEMGCGKGLESVFFALNGARVIGFDTNETVSTFEDQSICWFVTLLSPESSLI